MASDSLPSVARAALVVAVLVAALAGPGCGSPPPDECTPLTCEAFGRECGAMADGCGGTLACGACGAGLECSSAGRCETPCVPATCESLGKNCGSVSDGCGLRLDCGACSGVDACGAVEANVCAPPPDPCAAGAWDAYGGRFFRQTCSGCHEEFERYEAVAAEPERKLQTVLESGAMPKNRTLEPGEKQWVLDWIRCGRLR